MKKFIALFFVLITIVILFCSCGKIADNKIVDEELGLIFMPTPDRSSWQVSKADNFNKTELVVPSSYNGFKVTSIGYGDGAFSQCKKLTSITIPDSVTSIGAYAFSGCTGLTSITIPDSVTSIGGGAFAGCTNLKYNEYDNGLYLGNDKNQYVVLVTAKDKNITSCNINKNTKIIYDNAFYDCKALTSVTIPDSVTSIGRGAFYDCTGLTSITIPDSVTSIGTYAFYACTNLKYNEYDNGLYLGNDKNQYVVLVTAKDKNITSCNINKNTKNIYGTAFYDCKALTSVTIPDGFTSIGESAFSGCTRLTSITIPNSVTFIGLDAFSGCTGLTSITIPNSVTFIGAFAFSDCTGLTSVKIGNSVTSIGYNAFRGCEGLTSITYTGTKADWDSISKIADWNYGTPNYTVHCTDGDISK